MKNISFKHGKKTIEITAPQDELSNPLIVCLKEEAQRLFNRNCNISKIEMNFSFDKSAKKENRVCEISLTIPGDSIFVRKRTSSFPKSVREAIDEAKRLIHDINPLPLDRSAVRA